MGSDLNFAASVARAAGRFGKRTAIERIEGDRLLPTSYAALMTDAGEWAGRLARQNVRRGDRVALLGDNDEPWIAAYLGALTLGAVAVPLDTSYRPDQVRAILDHSGASAICVSSRFRSSAADAPCPVLALERDPGAARGESRPRDPAEVALEDPAVLLYTSGTTADPKGVVLTHGNLAAERDAALAVVTCREDDAVLGVLPLFHALAQMANLLVPLSVGARVVFLETIDSASLLRALQQRGITIFACVPQFFYLIHQRVMGDLQHGSAISRGGARMLMRINAGLRDRVGWNPGRRWFARVHRALGPRMRLLVTGGSRFDPAIGRDLYGMGLTLLNGYGLTETCGAATVQRPGDRYTTSVGPPLPGVEIRIDTRPNAGADGGAGAASAAGEGEILVRGPIVMKEYFGRPDATREALRDGWLHTGDLGWLDADRRLHITGRSKEIIVLSSGKNIYPEEVEAQYQRSAFVKEICVIGRSDPGAPAAERLHAVVVPDEDALRARGAVNVRELIRFELEGQAVQLPAYKRVLSFDVSLTPLPRTTTGKLKRHEIQGLVHERAERRGQTAERPLTESERAWVADPAHAQILGDVASALRRDAVPPDANLELDLGLDSMERVELLTSLEHARGVVVSPEARATIFTVRQLVEAVGAPAPQHPRTPEPPSPWPALLASPPEPAVAALLTPVGVPRAVLLFVFFRAFRIAARVLVGFRIRGTRHLAVDGPLILAPNHQSHLDALLVGAALPFPAVRRLFFVGAAEYYQTPLSRWVARLASIVPVDPDRNLTAAMQVSAAGLRANRILVLFPEGERTIDGEIKTFRKGAALLSGHLGVPIVPTALDGPYTLWPRGRPVNWSGLLPWRAPRVSLIFGAPQTARRDADAAETAALQRAVQQLFDELRRERGAGR